MPKTTKHGKVTRREYNGRIEWSAPSQVVKNSRENLVYYKSSNEVADYNDDPYHGGGRKYTKQKVLESVDYVQRNIEYHFGIEVLKEILSLISKESTR